VNRKTATTSPQAAASRGQDKPRKSAVSANKTNGRRSSMSDEAYGTIKAGILRNKYPGGFQILEDELAHSLEMSRTPVREALLRLQSEGLISLIPRRGMRVLPLSLDDIREAYQLLGFMETAAAEMIAARPANREDIAELKDYVDQMEAALKRDDILQWAEVDELFHRALVNLSGNQRLGSIANTLLDQTERFRRFTMRLRKKPTHFVSTHADLVRKIKEGDIAGIREVHLNHKQRWLEEMKEIVEKFNITRV
jgi:DNA-binding GntR family transcriptional regulator